MGHELRPARDRSRPEPLEDERCADIERDDNVLPRSAIANSRDAVEIIGETRSAGFDEALESDDLARGVEAEEGVGALIVS